MSEKLALRMASSRLTALVAAMLLVGCGGGSGVGSVEGFVYAPAGRSASLPIVITRAPNPPAGYVPIVGAHVTVSGGGKTLTVDTDQFGHFAVSDVPTGIAHVHIVDPSGNNAPLDTELHVNGKTTAFLGSNGQVSMVSQSATSLDVAMDNPDVSQWPQVSTTVSILDPVRQTPIIGLTSDRFAVSVNGQPAQNVIIAAQQVSSSPAAVVLVQDVSGSMDGQPFLDAKQSLHSFVDNLGGQDKAELEWFADTVSEPSGFTSDKSALHSSIDSLPAPGGATALYDGIKKALDELVSLPSTFGRAVVVMTDGGENNSSIARSDLFNAITADRIPIYAIGLGGTGLTRRAEVSRTGRSATSRQAEVDLQEIAQASGGAYFFAATSSDLLSIYTKITARTQQKYSLTYDDTLNGNNRLQVRASAFNLTGISPAVPYVRKQFDFPLPDWSNRTITQGFGAGHPEDGPQYVGHTGIDVSASVGTPVLNVGAGKVAMVKNSDSSSDSWGRIVIIQHDVTGVGSRYSMYAHLSVIDPVVLQAQAKGTVIPRGQQIGKSGLKGTGPHLHFEIRDDGTHPGPGYTKSLFSVDRITWKGSGYSITYFDPLKFISNPF